MAQGFQSSFIPKGVPGEEGVSVKKKETSIVGMISLSIFVITILGSAGLFVYKGILARGVEDLRSQLAEAGKAIDDEKIKEMSSFSRKLGLIQSIVDRHQVISGFMSSLASSTVTAVSFTEFSYGTQTDNLVVTMQGNADKYSTVALQENVFSKNQYWNSVSFSDLNLDGKGKVSFKVSVSVDPKIVTYAPFIPETKVQTQEEIEEISIPENLEGIDDIGSLEDIESSINGL